VPIYQPLLRRQPWIPAFAGILFCAEEGLCSVYLDKAAAIALTSHFMK
jgi:hypothetical protein